MGDARYRCDGCGNLTRFDVTTSRRTRAFHHYTVGGDLQVEEETVLSHHVDEVVCRWCGHGRSVVELDRGDRAGTGPEGTLEAPPGGQGASAPGGGAADGGAGGGGGRQKQEPGAPSPVR
jgi:hypothetical protein